MDITSLIVEAVSGAVGGNVAGAAMKENSLGTAGNSIAGILGGGLGGTILHSVMGSAAAGGGMDLQSILANRLWRWGRRRDSHGRRRHHQEQDGPEIAMPRTENPARKCGRSRTGNPTELLSVNRFCL